MLCWQEKKTPGEEPTKTQTISAFSDYLLQPTTLSLGWKICSPGLNNHWNQNWAEVYPPKFHFYLSLNRTCNLNYWNAARGKNQKYLCRNWMSSAKGPVMKGKMAHTLLSNEKTLHLLTIWLPSPFLQK